MYILYKGQQPPEFRLITRTLLALFTKIVYLLTLRRLRNPKTNTKAKFEGLNLCSDEMKKNGNEFGMVKEFVWNTRLN